jgi:hypothetical protein
MRPLVALALIVCTACDGSAESDAGVDASGLDAGSLDAGATDGGVLEGDLERDYCAPLAAELCESAGACGCGGVLSGGTLDPAGCRASFVARCMESWSFLSGAVERGDARIRRDAAIACAARVRDETPTCARPSGVTTFATCEPIFTGPAAIGEACAAVPVCADGAGACIEGTCVARRGAGEACGTPYDCATGLICAGSTCSEPGALGAACSEATPCGPPLRCIEGACAALAAEDAACASTPECAVGATCTAGACADRESASCTTDADCGNLSRCGRPRACGPRLPEGASCDRDALCAPGLFCDDALGQCASLPGVDEPCVRGVLCAAGLGCDELAGSVCRAPGGEGSPCLASEAGPSVCAGDLGCLETDAGQVCGPLGGDGARCTVDSRCAVGFGCAFEAEGSFCRPIRGEGETCESDRVCGDGLFCDFDTSTCAALRPAGAPCSAGHECEGVCVPSSSGDFVCADRPGEGDTCVLDEQCGPERACIASEVGACLDEICLEVL